MVVVSSLRFRNRRKADPPSRPPQAPAGHPSESSIFSVARKARKSDVTLKWTGAQPEGHGLATGRRLQSRGCHSRTAFAPHTAL